MIGLTSDTFLTFACLHAINLGYECYPVMDASGSSSVMSTSLAITRMATAGAKIMTWWAVGAELLADARNPEGQ